MDAKQIKATLFLPQTSFPLKNTDWLVTEAKIRQKWKKKQVYQKLLVKNQKNASFILHDGPTYANGKIHLGHLLNQTLKDIIVRFYASQGYYTPLILGWDCHGLPIEQKVLQNPSNPQKDLRESCQEYAKQQLELQKNQLEQLGIFTDYQRFYSTEDKAYQAEQIRVFGQMVEKNLVYRNWKPVYWSCSHATALAENEVEYLIKKDYSLYFSLAIEGKLRKKKPVYLLIWTTQPWTIPANQLVAVKKEASYRLVELNGKYLIVLNNRINQLPWLKAAKITSESLSGEELIGLKYHHPYRKFWGKIVDGQEFIQEKEGTGVLHCAPAFGLVDFLLAQKAQIPTFCPLDEKGYFTSALQIPPLVGKHYLEVNQLVVEDLKNKGQLISQSYFFHSYPHDWRDKSPLIYRLTEQWFVNIQTLKLKLLENLEKVNWHPSWAKKRMEQAIASRGDWCISRQRKWGVPIPVIFQQNQPLLNSKIINYVAKIFEKDGSNKWFNGKILPQLQKKFPQLIKKTSQLGTDILDVWFDSGISHWFLAKILG